MNNINNVINDIDNGSYDIVLNKMYCYPQSGLDFYKERYKNAINEFVKIYGENKEIELFSAAGRTEIGGNHTDHQFGHVLASSINLDVIAIATKNNDGLIRIKSEGYPMDEISISELSPNQAEYNRASGLIRGVTAKFKSMGYEIGGFDAYTTSNVLKGSGLSSSAAFEVLIGNIINTFYAKGEVSAVEIAKIGQYAENVYFGKPCGLMDQMACSVGGIIAINFKEPENPQVEAVDFAFEKMGYSLCIIDSGGNHADLTDEYSAIPQEMKSVAIALGKEVLSQLSENDIYENIKMLRGKCGDRAVLRAIHFFEDDKRVSKQVTALKQNHFDEFLKEVSESGRSSYMKLQNVCASSQPKVQAVSITLALCEKLLTGKGAFRVHGGGFAGTVQAFVPNDMVEEFKIQIEKSLGENMCHILSIRSVGGLVLTKN